MTRFNLTEHKISTLKDSSCLCGFYFHLFKMGTLPLSISSSLLKSRSAFWQDFPVTLRKVFPIHIKSPLRICFVALIPSVNIAQENQDKVFSQVRAMWMLCCVQHSVGIQVNCSAMREAISTTQFPKLRRERGTGRGKLAQNSHPDPMAYSSWVTRI